MVIIIEDNWTLIKHCLLKHGEVDHKILKRETQISDRTIGELLNSHVKRGEVIREFREYVSENAYGNLGRAKRHKFIWRLAPC